MGYVISKARQYFFKSCLHLCVLVCVQDWRVWIITPYWLQLQEFWCDSWLTPRDRGESLTRSPH